MRILFYTLFLICFSLSSNAQLVVESGENVQEPSGGYGIFGSASGYHVAIDQDDVQAKNGASVFSRLDLNYHGGNITLNNGALFSQFSTKRIGIGTDDPMDKLHVKDGSLRIEDGTITMLNTTASPKTATISLNGLGELSIGTPSVGIFIDDDVEHIGIRNSSPAANLHIKQSTDLVGQGAGLRYEKSGSTNYWETHIDIVDEYVFVYNGGAKSYIETDGDYIKITPANDNGQSSKRMNNVLSDVLDLQPLKHTAKGSHSESWLFDHAAVAEVFPNIVTEKDGQFGIAYDNFSVLAIKAIQELKSELDERDEIITENQDQIADLQQQINELKLLMQTQALANLNTNSPSPANLQLLQQNEPNPHNGQTTIRYELPEKAANYQLQITHANGQPIQLLELDRSGNVQFNNSTLSNGVYQYSILQDGKVISTRQMVIQK